MLTTILKDSLGGNTKTIMIATVNAAVQQMDESLSTCRFAQRVARIKNEVPPLPLGSCLTLFSTSVPFQGPLE